MRMTQQQDMAKEENQMVEQEDSSVQEIRQIMNYKPNR